MFGGGAMPIDYRFIFTVVAALAIVIGTWYVTATYKDAVWTSKFDTYKKDLAELHAKNLNEVLQKERAERDRADKLEVKYHDANSKVKSLRADNSRLVSERGMRDPGKTYDFASLGRDATDTSGNSSNSSPTGQLSREASEFLLDLAEDADKAAIYANTCYEYFDTRKEAIK